MRRRTRKLLTVTLTRFLVLSLVAHRLTTIFALRSGFSRLATSCSFLDALCFLDELANPTYLVES